MLRDLLWACRWLGKNRLFTLAILGILALGTGANTAIFSIVDAVLLRPLPYAAADRLVRIQETSTKEPRYRIPMTDYQLLASRSDLFEKAAADLRDDVTIYGAGEPTQVTARRITPDLFSLLGARARLGRTPRGDPHEAVLSERLWQRQFHGDSGVIGRAILVGDETYTIVGVMPAEFEFPYPDVEMWLPYQATPGVDFGFQIMAARLREGLTAAQAQKALDIAARQLEQQDPRKNNGLRISLTPYRDDLGGKKYEQTLVLVLAAVGLVLLIACADVASLLLSRAVQRQKEIAVRASLGAVFGRLLRQLLAEGMAVAIAGSAAGLLVAHYTLRLLLREIAAMPIPLAHMNRVGINGRVLAFNVALCLLLAALVSIAPAVMAFRTNLQDVLRSGQRGGGSRGAGRLFSILIGCEAAFAFLLLVGSGLMVRSLIRLQQSDHGIHADHVLTMRVPIGSLTQTRPKGQYSNKPRQMQYYRAILERLERVPGVDAAAVVNNLPLSGVNTTLLLEPPGRDPIGVPARTISAQYFRVMGIPLVAGRFFTDADAGDSPPVAIVNEQLAAQMFPGRDAIGQKLVDATIVGVVRNTPQMSYEAPPKEEMYRPYQQVIFGVFLSTMVVRTSRDPLSLAPALRKEVWAVDPNQPIVKVETMDQVITDSIWRPRFSAWLFSVLGGLSLVLTSAGVYSVMAYTTALRAREVGIRVALGATPRNVVTAIVKGAMMPLAGGLVVSGLASLFLARLLASVLYEVKASDPVTYVGAAAVLVGIGAVASAIPAWRAATGDPVEALRTE